jgi:hypothetical protein
MTEGPLDNYLTNEEDAYFKNRGSSDAEDAVVENTAETIEEPAIDEPADSTEPRSDDNESAESDEDRSDEDEVEDDTRTKNERDYEKAFKAERHKRKELKEAFEANAKKTAEMETTLAQLKQSMLQNQQQVAQQREQAPPPRQEAAPDPEEDPLGYMQHQIKQQERAIIEHNNYLKQRHDAEQRNSQENAFKQAYSNAAQQYAQTNKDFTEAYGFLTDARVKEHLAAGFSKQEADALLIEEETTIVAKAFRDGVNPAERMYNLAKNRGYTANVAKAPAKSLADIKKGQANAKSLRGGGELNDAEPGIADIDGMDFETFDKFWAGYKSKSKGG